MSGHELISPLADGEGEHQEYKGDVDIFVPQSQEAEYLDKHGLDVRRLANGATLIGGTRKVDDLAESNITLTFPSSPVLEPVGKSGITHFTEHIMLNKPGRLAPIVEAGLEAATNIQRVGVTLEGVSNQNVRNYGVWPMLPVLLEQYTSPLQVTEEEVEIEKHRIYAEEEYRKTYDLDKNFLFNQLFFSPDNPINYLVIGTEQDRNSITREDVIARSADIFIPRGMEGVVFTEGSQETNKAIMDILEGHLNKMQGGGKRPAKLNDETLVKVNNPDFQNGGGWGILDTEDEGDVSVTYVWSLPPEAQYSYAYYAQAEFYLLAFKKMFSFFKENGIGYKADDFALRYGKVNLLGIDMHIPARPDILDFAQKIKPYLKQAAFSTFGERDIRYINGMNALRYAAKPISVKERINSTSYGLKHYGRIIDNEKIQEIHKGLSPQHFKYAFDQFTSVEPAIVIIGNTMGVQEQVDNTEN